MSIKKYKELFSLKSIHKIEKFIDLHNLDFNHENKYGEHLLFINEDLNIIKWLIENKKIDINYKNKFGKNALFDADIIKSKYLISQGINLNETDNIGKNALFYSDLKKAKLLLNSGININQISCKNRNVAFGKTDEELLSLYIKHDIDLNQKDYTGKGIFDSIGLYALGSEEYQLKFLKFLVSNGLDPTRKNAKGEDLLFHCVNENFSSGVVYLIKECGVDVNQLDNNNNNVLFLARNILMADTLVKSGANLHQINNEGQNLLFQNDFTLFKYYAYRNVNINQIDNNGKSILNFHYIREKLNYCLSDNIIQKINKDILYDSLKHTPDLLEIALKKYSKYEKQSLSEKLDTNINEQRKVKRL